MAKKRKSPTPKPNLWEAHKDDAIRLAALRWFALEIERLGIQIYATDHTRYAAMEQVLRDTMKRMGKLAKGLAAADPDECPNGYILCKDGTCAPMCDPGAGGDFVAK